MKRLIGLVFATSGFGLGGLSTSAFASVPPPTDPAAAFTEWGAANGQMVSSVACSITDVTTCYGLDASLSTITAMLNPDGSFTLVTPSSATTATPTMITAGPTMTTAAPSANVGTRDSPVPVGVPADIGDGWTLTVNSVNLDATDEVVGGNMFNEEPPAGSVYVLINVTATYNGSDDKTSPFIFMSGVTSSNVEISGLDSFVVAPDAFDSLSDVFAGGSLTGNFALAVPSAELASLVLYTSALFSSNDVYFAVR